MILVADSGSTKTAWILTGGAQSRAFTTSGLNPYHVDTDAIRGILAGELLPQTETDVSAVYFYGAGCTPAKIPEMTALFGELFPAARIEVHSDLTGACRGLCGRGAGMVGILGTGSNSALWDGEKIAANTPALGYLLGDEGSGTTLGRLFVSDCLKNQLPAAMRDEFLAAYGLTQGEIIERVYRRPMPNRFLASFAPFIAARRHIPEVRALVAEEFRRFLRRNVLQYGAAGLKIHFTGSIAFYFSDLLGEAVEAEGLALGTIVQSPIEGIAKYHKEDV